MVTMMRTSDWELLEIYSLKTFQLTFQVHSKFTPVSRTPEKIPFGKRQRLRIFKR